MSRPPAPPPPQTSRPVAPPPPRVIPVAPPVPREEVPAIMTSKPSDHLYSLKELASMFGLSVEGVKKRIAGVEPDGKRGQANIWQLSRVAILSSDVELSIQRQYDVSKRNDKTIGEMQTADMPLPTTDLGNMSPNQLKIYFQTVDIQQAYLKKRRMNLIEAGELIPKDEVNKSFVQVFRLFGNFLDTLPDVLERDGLIDPSQIDEMILKTDRLRVEMSSKVDKLADDLGD